MSNHQITAIIRGVASNTRTHLIDLGLIQQQCLISVHVFITFPLRNTFWHLTLYSISLYKYGGHVNKTPEHHSNTIFIWTGPAGTAVTITGTLFDGTTISNNVVKFGDVSCEVTAATASQITCTTGLNSQGPHDLWVSVKGVGAAIISGSLQFSYNAQITGTSPTAGSIGG